MENFIFYAVRAKFSSTTKSSPHQNILFTQYFMHYRISSNKMLFAIFSFPIFTMLLFFFFFLNAKVDFFHFFLEISMHHLLYFPNYRSILPDTIIFWKLSEKQKYARMSLDLKRKKINARKKYILNFNRLAKNVYRSCHFIHTLFCFHPFKWSKLAVFD